jgi:Zn-finger nucleic acid-binding protein
MNFRIHNLVLQFGRSREVIDLSSHTTFFHGPISSGKSSIAKLIDACLGGSIPENPAIKQEFVSAQLTATIGTFDVLFERSAGSNQVQVSWVGSDNQGATILAPIDNAPAPIWGDTVYGLSDLIFYLAGIGPMRVRRNKTDPDAPLIPLSFRDLMWYCYLEQDELDSTFFHLEREDPRSPKSRDVMRFVLGYYTDLLNELEQQLAREVEDHRTKLESAAQLRKFFSELGYESEGEIAVDIDELDRSHKKASQELQELRETHRASTHFTDDLRTQLRTQASELEREERALADLKDRLRQERSLRSELLSTKFKLARLETASAVLSGVEFDACPRCGTGVSELRRTPAECVLCGAVPSSSVRPESFRLNSSQRDLDARLIDIEQSIAHRERAVKRQGRKVDDLRQRKVSLDDQLTIEMRTYDSSFVSQIRHLERSIAATDQKLIGLRRDARIPAALRELEAEADRHLTEARRLRREIVAEKTKLEDRDSLVEMLERYFFEALYAAGFPSLTSRDRIQINRRNWLPYILPEGDESLAYTFYGAGSGGKKTLFNVCYSIALHRLTEEKNLPLPLFLIIDSPMKNIGNDVNKDIFLALYRYLYGFAGGEQLKRTQLIIIDTELAEPEVALDFKHRLMVAGDPENPPLIPYYKGH